MVYLLTLFCCRHRLLLRGELVEIACDEKLHFKDRDLVFGEPRKTDMTDFLILTKFLICPGQCSI